MGVALAEEARLRGAEVTLVAANLAVPPPGKVELVRAPTAAELEREVLARSDADVVLMAAAVADYRPAEQSSGKRPKNEEPWTVTLEPTGDVLAQLGAEDARVGLGHNRRFTFSLTVIPGWHPSSRSR